MHAHTAILKGQFGFDGETMTGLAGDIVTAAEDLYGAGVAAQVEAAFASRGIL
jgi:hypothetical protein